MAYPLVDKPSIAVLPVENFSDDTKLNFIASGLTEDLTAALSRAPGLFMIGRNSAGTYKGKPVDVKQVAEKQGVQYVLEGSLQKANDKLRITIQLVDALNGHHLMPHAFLAAVYADLDLMDEAGAEASVVMRLNPKFTASRFMQSQTLHDPVRDDKFKDLMKRAGLPE